MIDLRPPARRSLLKRPVRILSGVFCTLALAGTAMAREVVDPVRLLKADMPAPVVALIDRIVGCNHWAGEEPYDEQRRREINAAVASLRCQSLERDEQRILRRYRNDPRVSERLRHAREET